MRNFKKTESQIKSLQCKVTIPAFPFFFNVVRRAQNSSRVSNFSGFSDSEDPIISYRVPRISCNSFAVGGCQY